MITPPTKPSEVATSELGGLRPFIDPELLSINVEVKVSLIFGFHSLSEFYGSPESKENISKLVLSTCAIKLNCNKR